MQGAVTALIVLGFIALAGVAGYYLSFFIVTGPMVECADVACPVMHGLVAWPITSAAIFIGLVLVYRWWR